MPEGEFFMWQRVLSVGTITFSLVCGFLPVGLTNAQEAPRPARAGAVILAAEDSESTRERAEGVQERAERAKKEAAEAEAQALREQQKATTARLAELERELAEFKAHETDRGLVLTLGDVQFAPNQETLTADAARKLYPLVTILKDQPKRTIRIEGHADSRGEESYNLDLSQRRADAVRDFLVSNGIDSTRITARGYGENEAVASNITAAGRQENRRVDVIVLREGKHTTKQ
jgi:outer membrane protein OmpA-like peptidoglycan-associated protein